MKRGTRLLVIVLVIAAGLASRSSLASYLPVVIATYAGDTLWSLTLFLTLAFVFPCAGTLRLAVATIVISFGVELSQLYQAQWINAIRSTRFGALLLGAGFKFSDLACYSVGCLMGVAVELLVPRPTDEEQYKELLGTMFTLEVLGERLYQTLSSKCTDPHMQSVYQELMRNEENTRKLIEKKLTSIEAPLPLSKARFITNVLRPLLHVAPRGWLHSSLTTILKRRIYSNWHKSYPDEDAGFWNQLVEHEDLQHEKLDI